MFTALLTGQHKDRSAVGVKIVVMVPAETLTGESNAPGVSADRSWALPAEQARELARPRMEPIRSSMSGTHSSTTTVLLIRFPDIHRNSRTLPRGGLCPPPPTGASQLRRPGSRSVGAEEPAGHHLPGHDPPALLRDALMIRTARARPRAARCLPNAAILTTKSLGRTPPHVPVAVRRRRRTCGISAADTTA